MLNFDIISLNEVNTPLSVTFPGFVSFRSFDKNNAHRGGTCVFIRDYLSKYISNVDTSINDQVWIRFKCISSVLFSFCYVPPSDSPYFDQNLLSKIQEKVFLNQCSNGCILVGDFNARFGSLIRDLLTTYNVNDDEYKDFSYLNISDPLTVPNDNANVLVGICKQSDLLLVNNLKTQQKTFSSALTYCQGVRWVSELDHCLASVKLVNYIIDFHAILPKLGETAKVYRCYPGYVIAIRSLPYFFYIAVSWSVYGVLSCSSIPVGRSHSFVF